MTEEPKFVRVTLTPEQLRKLRVLATAEFAGAEAWLREIDAQHEDAKDEQGRISADVWHELERERERGARELRDAADLIAALVAEGVSWSSP